MWRVCLLSLAALLACARAYKDVLLTDTEETCSQLREQCMRCHYGVHTFTATRVGCSCECRESPCVRANCSASEHCETVELDRTTSQGDKYAARCVKTTYVITKSRRPGRVRLIGLGCQYALHGCCPNNVTIAQGPDNQGCGCQYTEHGCCPDRRTAASGPDYKGCACNTYQFGCCADGVSTATGPEQQGCHCRESKFGCCGDGDTPATGPDGTGCNCSSSRHGCCPDGRTEATGPKFLGCTDAPENKQAACGMSTDPGPCLNFTPMWYYDMSYGGCSRFWYGGCDGNGNRFSTKEECEGVCVQPSPKDACKLPSVTGACDADHRRWYYNSTQKKCIPFRYGGCLGNENNFATRELCQEQCEPSSLQEIFTTGALTEITTKTAESIEANEGSTTADGTTDVIGTTTLDPCSSFEFGCCADNETEATNSEKKGCPETDVLLTDTEETCSQLREQCMRCHYGVHTFTATRVGCSCECRESPCVRANCSASEHCETVELDRATSQGDKYAARCVKTTYVITKSRRPGRVRLIGLGCQYALHGCCPNNVTIAQGPDNQGCGCQYTEHGCCPDRRTTASGPDYKGCACNTYQFGCCADGVTTATGPEQQGCHCHESKFGCCGNGETPATGPDGTGCDCSSSRHGCCPDGRTEATGPKFLGCTQENKQAACGMSTDSGPCHNFTAMWYYDMAYGGCSRFFYGGCDGNGNRFSTKEECEGVCVQPSPKDACKLPSVTGACDADHRRWYYNSTQKKCIPFRYGGCLGNANNFATRELCQKQCEPSSLPEIFTTGALTEMTTKTAESIEANEGSTTADGTTDVIGTTTLDPCGSFEFGCCADNETEATNSEKKGCPETG